ncbi:peptidoglycan DD-metalloendopeptidase family protein [Shigella flexneri]
MGDGEVVVAKRSGAAAIMWLFVMVAAYTTRYMHLRKILVKPGQKVKRGDRTRFPVIRTFNRAASAL